MQLDRFDQKLLKLVQEDAGLTAEELSEHIGLSASAIQRRLRKLREEGVIARDVAVLDPARVGNPCFFVVSVQVERESPALVHQLRQWLLDQEHVQQIYYVTGEADFVCIVCTPDMASYEALMSRMMSEQPNVKHYYTNVVLTPVKRGLTLPIPSNGDVPPRSTPSE